MLLIPQAVNPTLENYIQGIWTLSLIGWRLFIVGKNYEPVQYVVMVIKLLWANTVPQGLSVHAFIL